MGKRNKKYCSTQGDLHPSPQVSNWFGLYSHQPKPVIRRNPWVVEAASKPWSSWQPSHWARTWMLLQKPGTNPSQSLPPNPHLNPSSLLINSTTLEPSFLELIGVQHAKSKWKFSVSRPAANFNMLNVGYLTSIRLRSNNVPKQTFNRSPPGLGQDQHGLKVFNPSTSWNAGVVWKSNESHNLLFLYWCS